MIRKGRVRAASAARTVERGKNPEDGTGEGVASLHLPCCDRPVSRPCERGGCDTVAPGVHVLEGSKNPRRGDSRARLDGEAAQAVATIPERGQPRRSSALKGKRTPRESLPGLGPGVRLQGEHPEAVSNGVGGAREANSALPERLKFSEGDANSTRARPGAGDRARPL
jgi:hypothetical protein